MGRKENLIKAKETYKDIMQQISSDKNKWKEFLDFSSKFYKYSFTENLLMFAQNPKVTMCATLEEWNSIGRWIKPNSTSIKILRDTENEIALDYVFDVSDTYARRDMPNAYTDERLQAFKWKATEQQVVDILNFHFKNENLDNLETIVANYMTTAIDNSGILLNLTDAEELMVLKPEFLELMIKNTTYQIAIRCGIRMENIERFFSEYETFANSVAINIIGNCVNHFSSELLRIIEFKMKEIKREELKYGDTRKIWNNSEEKFKRTLSNEVQRINDRGDTNGKTIREGTRNIETEGDNRETSKREESSTENKRVYSDGEIQSNDREYGRGIVTTNVGRKNIENDEKEVEKSTSFSFTKNQISDEIINRVLAEGGNVEDSVKRLKDILNNNNLSKKEQIVAVKNEYGDAGSYRKEYSWESRAKGLKITDNTTNTELTLSWAEVVNRMKNIFHIENKQLGFETLFELSYQQNDIVEEEDNSKYDFINDLLGKNIKLSDREYKVSKLKLDTNEIELYDQTIKGWYPIFRLINLDEFILEYTKSNTIIQNEEIQEEVVEKINYVIPYEKQTETRNARQRVNDNIKAIKLLKEIESQDRLATKEEQEVLALYSGWGGLSKVFDTRITEWQTQQVELKGNLTEEELAEAKSSSLNAFYTSSEIIDSMYLGLDRLGFKGGNILEPSARNRKFYREISK